ncbi:MAG: hypothetical protein QM778_10720 [Myxococcales bacterium]
MMRWKAVLLVCSFAALAVACNKPEAEAPAVAESAAKVEPPQAAQAVPGEITTGDAAQADNSCRACRQRQCSNIEGMNFNPIKDCFANADPLFTEQCTAAKKCMSENHCGIGPMGTIDCFCGTVETEACVFGKTAPNGPCQQVFWTAARETVLTEMMHKYDNVQRPLGVAHALRVCEARFCKVCLEKEPGTAKL